MTKLILKPNDISEITGFSGNIDIDALIPSINIAQNIHVKRILGVELYNKILAGNLTGNYLIMYNDFIVFVLAFYSTSIYLSMNTIKTANNGSFKSAGASGDVLPTPQEVTTLSATHENVAKSYENMLVEFITSKNIPEYAKNTTQQQNAKTFY